MKFWNKEKVGHGFERVVYCIECIASVFILIVVLYLMGKLVVDIFSDRTIVDMTSSKFSNLLGNILSLIVGLEFVKLLTRQRSIDFVEVLMLAISRQMVVEHMGMAQMLIGVCAIGVLFAIRRFLFEKEDAKMQG